MQTGEPGAVGMLSCLRHFKEEVLKTKYYDDIQVDWTDDEFKRLEEIKENKKKENKKPHNDYVHAAFLVTPEIKQMAMEYAEAQGMSFSVFVRGIVEDVIKKM